GIVPPARANGHAANDRAEAVSSSLARGQHVAPRDDVALLEDEPRAPLDRLAGVARDRRVLDVVGRPGLDRLLHREPLDQATEHVEPESVDHDQYREVLAIAGQRTEEAVHAELDVGPVLAADRAIVVQALLLPAQLLV